MKDILLVEDHEELNQLMCSFLQRAGYTVKGALSGEDALAFWREERARLVILDVALPGQDGFAVCKAIRESSAVPLLFLSARTGKEDQMNGYLAGADDYMEKPVDMDILRAKVSALMHRYYENREQKTRVQSGTLTIDTDAQKVYCRQKEIALPLKNMNCSGCLSKTRARYCKRSFCLEKSGERTASVRVRHLQYT